VHQYTSSLYHCTRSRGLKQARCARSDLVVIKSDELTKTIAKQHGVISRKQALEHGMSRSQIEGRLANGFWVQLANGVYAVSTSGPTWERQLWAAVRVHPAAYAAGRSAGFLHGMPGFLRSRPEVLAPFPGNGRAPLGRVIRSRHFASVATTTVQDYTVTSVAETILTLAMRETRNSLERIIDNELARRSCSIADFNPILQRLKKANFAGLSSLRSIVRSRSEDAYQPPMSELERLLYRLLDRPEFPPFRRQAPMDYPRLAATTDAFIPQWRLIVEADGRRWHSREADFEKDRARDNAAAAAGLVVVRFTYRMLKDDAAGCSQTLLETGRWRSTG